MTQELTPLYPEKAVDLYLAQREEDSSERTVQAHEYRLKHFLRWCEEEGIDNVNDHPASTVKPSCRTTAGRNAVRRATSPLESPRPPQATETVVTSHERSSKGSTECRGPKGCWSGNRPAVRGAEAGPYLHVQPAVDAYTRMTHLGKEGPKQSLGGEDRRATSGHLRRPSVAYTTWRCISNSAKW